MKTELWQRLCSLASEIVSVALTGSHRRLFGKGHSMRSYLASLTLGVAVGVVYGLVKVRSPAPPTIALLGLLGMLAGEQAVLLVRSRLLKDNIVLSTSCDRADVAIRDVVRGGKKN
jgi:XapX domain-containing protein